LASFSWWGWFEIVAATLLSIGCVGERVLLSQEAPLKDERLRVLEKKKYLRKRVFVCLLAIGVTMELFSLPVGLHDTANLDINNSELFA
jgi:hypothetical protein